MAGWVSAATLDSFAAEMAIFYCYVGDVPRLGSEFHILGRRSLGLPPRRRSVRLAMPTDAGPGLAAAGAGADRTAASVEQLDSVPPDLTARIRQDPHHVRHTP
jgi:hypothetical protein